MIANALLCYNICSIVMRLRPAHCWGSLRMDRVKKQYFSTFVPGMEDVVERLMRHEGGITPERMMHGAAIYRSVREPDLPYMRHTFLVLTQFGGAKNLDEAVKRLLSRGEWLDKMPYETLQGKKFRIVTMNEGQLQSVNMRYLNMLEKVIMDHTGMRTLRERPEVELWIDRREKSGTYFLWRVGARRGAKSNTPGALRPDFAMMLANYCRVGGKQVVNLAAHDAGLAKAFLSAGAKGINVVCENPRNRQAFAQIQRVRVLDDATEIGDHSTNVVFIHVPEKMEAKQPEAYLREQLTQAGRMVTKDGMVMVVALYAQAENAISRANWLDIEACFHVTLSGKKLAVWQMRQSEEE